MVGFPEGQLAIVTRIYENFYGGDYMDFAPGALVMVLGSYEHDDRGCALYDKCLAVRMTPDAVDQFARMGWQPSGPLWVPVENCILIDDVSIRAACELLDERPVIMPEPYQLERSN